MSTKIMVYKGKVKHKWLLMFWFSKSKLDSLNNSKIFFVYFFLSFSSGNFRYQNFCYFFEKHKCRLPNTVVLYIPYKKHWTRIQLSFFNWLFFIVFQVSRQKYGFVTNIKYIFCSLIILFSIFVTTVYTRV